MTTEQNTTHKANSTARNSKASAAAVETAKDQFARAAETQFKAADDVAAFGKSNIEAFLQAGSIFFNGVEEITRTVVGLSQAQLETGINAAKAFVSVKSLTEVTDLQNAYTKTAFDNAVSEATRLSEIAVRVSNDTLQPLSARVTATIEQISKPVAAF
jgi:phasin family protein